MTDISKNVQTLIKKAYHVPSTYHNTKWWNEKGGKYQTIIEGEDINVQTPPDTPIWSDVSMTDSELSNLDMSIVTATSFSSQDCSFVETYLESDSDYSMNFGMSPGAYLDSTGTVALFVRLKLDKMITDDDNNNFGVDTNAIAYVKYPTDSSLNSILSNAYQFNYNTQLHVTSTIDFFQPYRYTLEYSNDDTTFTQLTNDIGPWNFDFKSGIITFENNPTDVVDLTQNNAALYFTFVKYVGLRGVNNLDAINGDLTVGGDLSVGGTADIGTYHLSDLDFLIETSSSSTTYTGFGIYNSSNYAGIKINAVYGTKPTVFIGPNVDSSTNTVESHTALVLQTDGTKRSPIFALRWNTGSQTNTNDYDARWVLGPSAAGSGDLAFCYGTDGSYGFPTSTALTLNSDLTVNISSDLTVGGTLNVNQYIKSDNSITITASTSSDTDMVFNTESGGLKIRFECETDTGGFEIIRQADLDTHLKSYDADLYVNSRGGSLFLQANKSNGDGHTHLTCYDEVVDINGSVDISSDLTVGGGTDSLNVNGTFTVRTPESGTGLTDGFIGVFYKHDYNKGIVLYRHDNDMVAGAICFNSVSDNWSDCFVGKNESDMYIMNGNDNGDDIYIDAKGSVISESGQMTLSDNRLKHNESELTNSLESIRRLKCLKYFKTRDMYEPNHNFELNSDGLPLDESGNLFTDYKIEIGLVAQDVYEIEELKNCVHPNLTNKKIFPNRLKPWTVDYNSIHIHNISALQEVDRQQQADKVQIAELETEVSTLKNQVSTFETQMSELLARIASLENNNSTTTTDASDNTTTTDGS